ncbi:hypothetical protein QOZ80_2AG0116150 [Eleusine coracana subsp. coracana]|nr:hypothetical protein QOZ80_2AG0116150 [Eleusine coracana subsp. coracana]
MPGARRGDGPTPMPHAATRRVAVVGAGAAGLAAARELLRDGHAVRVFEKSSRAGGTWAYDPRADPLLGRDPGRRPQQHVRVAAHQPAARAHGLLGLPAGRAGLRGRPAHVPGPQGDPRLPRRLRRGLRRREARQVPRRGAPRGAPPPSGNERAVDGGVAQGGRRGGGGGVRRRRRLHRALHRASGAQDPRNLQVARKASVVVGLGASGIDIAREISRVAKEVHIASRYCQDRLGKVELYPNTWMHAEIDCVQDDGLVRFAEGPAVDADTILYCTGYRYYFPFLDLDGFTVDDNRVGPLYKHVFPPKYAPNLSFIGLPSKSIVFQSFELEAKWVVAVLSGRVTLPSEEDMLAAVLKDYRRMEEAGTPKRHTHVLWPEWVEYFNWLAEQVEEPHLETRRYEMYEKAIKCIWSLDESYRDRWDEQEEQCAS